ncbi:class IV adenylate cyclase [Planctomycetota bacterium]
MPGEKHTEIEAKLRVADLTAVETKLQELQAPFLGEQLQTDDYFENSQGTLAREDRCLRLRHEQVDDQETLFITYKGPKQAGAFKIREELEVEVSDGETTRLLFGALGYGPALVVKKSRRLYRYQDCLVGLDRLPALGSFVEIEGPSESQIAQVQETLGLSSCPHIPESYACLMAAQEER